MKITAAQIQWLIYFASQMLVGNAALTQEGKEKLGRLITQINNQQSMEIKDVE